MLVEKAARRRSRAALRTNNVTQRDGNKDIEIENKPHRKRISKDKPGRPLRAPVALKNGAVEKGFGRSRKK